MVSGRLKEWALGRGWTIKDGVAFGDYQGYMLTAFDGMGYKAFAFLLPELEDSTKTALLQFFRANKARLKLRDFAIQDRALVVQLMEQYRSAKLDEMDALVEALTGELRAQGVHGGERCCFCGKDGAGQTVFIGEMAAVAHEACFDQAAGEAERARLERAYEQKNYGPGFAGAILGALVAAIPWVLVQVYLERVAAILGYLIGVGAKAGYSFLKGKTGPLTRWLVLAAAVVSVVVAELVINLLVMRKMGLPIGLDGLIMLLGLPEVLRAFLKELGLSMFMALLGLWSVFSDLRRQEKAVVPVLKKA